MKIKILSFLLLPLSISFSLLASPLETQDPTADYQEQAQEWAEKVIHRVDRYFLPDLMDFLYASYMRSYMTLIVQKDYLELIKRFGSGWNHIISTRLNPSKELDFDTSILSIDDTLMHQLELFQQNCGAQKRYIDLLNRLADDRHDSYLGKNSAHDYRPCRIMVDALRNDARTVVADSLIGVIDQIQQEIQKAQQIISQAAELFKSEGQLKRSNFVSRSMTELLWYYRPQFMVKSFVNFDKGYTTASKHCLDAYLESQDIGNKIWHSIEIARASYYAAHYQALFEKIHARDPESVNDCHQPEELIRKLTDYTCLI